MGRRQGGWRRTSPAQPVSASSSRCGAAQRPPAAPGPGSRASRALGWRRTFSSEGRVRETTEFWTGESLESVLAGIAPRTEALKAPAGAASLCPCDVRAPGLVERVRTPTPIWGLGRPSVTALPPERVHSRLAVGWSSPGLDSATPSRPRPGHTHRPHPLWATPTAPLPRRFPQASL